jgi:predicted short-subunit dehydrogenase-like oxidoreductase (DUF2520 family)
MRELERNEATSTSTPRCCAIVGRGRMGNALAAALDAAGWEVEGPLGRGAAPAAPVVLLCVPDREIAPAAAAILPGPLVGHCSGATGLAPLAPHEAFSVAPIMTVTAESAPLEGAGCLVDGATPRALAVAAEIAASAGMTAVRIPEEERVAYHAAASMASNFLVALEAAAERVAETAGIGRELLAPLVRATVENWAAMGSERALTGPIARGDELTAARQRAVVAARAPELLELWDALAARARALAPTPAGAA